MAVRKPGGLGRGLDALFESTSFNEEVAVDLLSEESDREEKKTLSSDRINYVDIDEVEPNRTQPRKNFDEEKIADLAESIRIHGVIQPIVVRPSEEREGYEIVAGERRWRAAQQAGLKKIPCIVKQLSDSENMLLAIIENMQREDLNPIEEAFAFRVMIDRYELTQAEVSRSVGKSRPYIANSLRLLKLPEAVQNLVIEGHLSAGHARAIAGVEDEEMQIRLADLAKDGDMSVRELERMISEAASMPEKKRKERQKKSEEIASLEKELKALLGTKVKLPNAADKGKIEISFTSREERDRLISLLKTLSV